MNLKGTTRPPAMASSLPPPPASTASTNYPFSFSLLRLQSNFAPPCPQLSIRFKAVSNFRPPSAKFPIGYQSKARVNATAPSSVADAVARGRCSHWMVLIERPPEETLHSREEVIKYCGGILQSVLGSDEDPQSCIYDVSCDTHFGFCCDIDLETSQALAGLPGVLLVRPDPDRNSGDKDYSVSKALLEGSRQLASGPTLLFPVGSSEYWLVRMDRPRIGVISKAQMVDFYVEMLTKVLGNEKEAQMCIYHVSWQSNFGFCCELDEESARELIGIPGVLSVQPDDNFGSENKDYRGDGLLNSTKSLDPPDAGETKQINPKKLFITGLSFYTSEKTLRAAFEPFGKLVAVNVIMDKISKRSKGYAFVEYTTKEAASAALQEMNGKIINGWMIVVDMAKNTPRYDRRPKA